MTMQQILKKYPAIRVVAEETIKLCDLNYIGADGTVEVLVAALKKIGLKVNKGYAEAIILTLAK